MRQVIVQRVIQTGNGTKGELRIVGSDLKLYTMENPWLRNERMVSCIPAGIYNCSIVNSPRFGKVYGVHDVPNRSHILFHKGNSPEDTSGCILLGATARLDSPNMWVSNSALAFEKFYAELERKPFVLTIIDPLKTSGDAKDA